MEKIIVCEKRWTVLRRPPGFSLVEVIVGMSLFVGLFFILANTSNLALRMNKQVELASSCNILSTGLLSEIQNDTSIRNTMANVVNGGGLPNGIGAFLSFCANPVNAANSRCTSFDVANHFNVVDKNSNLAFDGQFYNNGVAAAGLALPAAPGVPGFRLDGSSCFGFNPQLGNAACPLKFEIAYAYVSPTQINVKAALMNASSALGAAGVQKQECDASKSLNFNVNIGTVGGVPTIAIANPPPPVPHPREIEDVDTGGDHSCAVLDGALFVFGKNDHGQCGRKTGADKPYLTPVQKFSKNIQKCAGGERHTCVIQDGKAWCMGDDSDGQCGDGFSGAGRDVDDPDLSKPINIPGAVTHICPGDRHTCAVADGGVWCWGHGAEGELGDGTGLDSLVPVRVILATGASPPLEGATHCSSGSKHSCATAGGRIYCWGDDTDGKLGDDDGTFTQKNKAVAVKKPVFDAVDDDFDDADHVACGNDHTCATRNGKAYCWGKNDKGQIGKAADAGLHTRPSEVFEDGIGTSMSGAREISCHRNHTCVGKSDSSSIECWGENTNGALGDNTTVNNHLPSKPADPATGLPGISGGCHASAGGTHTCALSNGELECWGKNTNGQLGDNAPGIDQLKPKTIVSVQNTAVAAYPIPNQSNQSIGDFGVGCAVVNGAAQCWGPQNTGLRVGSLDLNLVVYQPEKVVGPLPTRGVTKVAAGLEYNSCAIANGGVWCWGDNTNGQLGDGTFVSSGIPVQVRDGTLAGFPPLTGVTDVKIALGEYICAIANGGVWCWGNNPDGQLGNGTNIPSAYARPVVDAVGTPLTGVTALSIAASYSATAHGAGCAISKGNIYCWGCNDTWLLGQPQFVLPGPYLSTLFAMPVLKAAPTLPGVIQPSDYFTDATSIAVGRLNACAVKSGAVYCWGASPGGGLGNGPPGPNLEYPTVLLEPALQSGVQTVTGDDSAYHHCALAKGQPWCWGWNAAGELGTGISGLVSMEIDVPTRVVNLTSGVSMIKATGYSTCAKQNGQLYCWGTSGAIGTTGAGGPVPLGPLSFGP